MSTVARMRLFFREIAVVSSAVTLIFFCSCERHHPEELPAEHVATGEHASPEGDEHHAAPGTAVVPIPTKPTATPAEFFPASTPH